MCGIIAITTSSKANVSKMITTSLKKLEYRGYDSVGIATINNGKIEMLKDIGTIDKVNKRLSLESLPGTIGIGHTRWATHGSISQENAHPHSDCTGNTIVVHNGIIENYLELRNTLQENGHRFSSETDSEVIAHLMEEELKKNNQKLSVINAFKRVLTKIEGTYAITLIHSGEPDTIFLARKDSPLVIGVREDTKFAASDIPAFLEYTKKVIVLKNGEIATLTPQAVYIEKNGFRVQPKPVIISWTAESAQKSGYPHFMLKEIHEQPIALKNTLNTDPAAIMKASNKILKAERIIFLACGTSYHAALTGYNQLHRILGKKPLYKVIASEYETYSHLIDEDTLIIAISQSGETLDVMKGLTPARKLGASIISVANVIDSSIPRYSHISLYTKAGPEIGVAATKTHTAQVALLARLALQVEHDIGLTNRSEFTQNLEDLITEAPQITRTIINQNEFKAKRLASRISNQNHAYFLARGFNMPIALEGALKLKEISYIHAEAFPAGESKHGPIAIVEPNFPVVMIAPNDWTAKKMLSNTEEMLARGAYIISVTEQDHTIIERSDYSFILPVTSLSLLRPLTHILPLQMLAYYTAVRRGFDPDKPKNLAKTVTVE
ncbi:MAG: glutamine--fructose-6-phosphate transaminase (isomerizing) [Candidatus Heimdallarchaeota archaeon]|nr:MAG: glutamine--fructose-6-phosphate transaminase (isomerizing) [Candidatus Heimdallarchaeota archaeon]